MRFLTRLAIIVVLISILLVVIPPSAAQSDQNDGAPLPSVVLIEQAYRNGRINYDTAIQYKVFSIFEPQRLPAEYQSTTPAKSATSILIEVNRNWQILRPETRNKLSGYPVGRLGLPLFRGPTLSGPESTYITTHFQIHYTTSGVDAVDTTDVSPSNGIPDYIENMGTELENVWTTELSTMGWLQPPSDVSADGNSDYDVYVEDMLYYGYAQAEAYADQGTATGDNENSASVTEVNAAYGYIALENDYSGFPNTPLYNIQVTAAHEFNHAIQFGYDVWEEAWLMEATATWIEDEVYDSINDNLQYLTSYFNNPDVAMPSQTPGLHWYGDWIFPRYISEHHGGQSTVRSIWENSVNYDSYYGYYSFDAIQDALSSVGTSLPAVFSNFTVANYVMSTCPTNDPYCYEEASSYPSVYIEGNISFSGSIVNYTPSDGVGNYSADYITINSTTDQARITVSGASSSITYAARVIGMQSGVPTVVDIPMSGSPLSGSVSISTASYDTVILIVQNETPDSSTLTQSGYSVQIRLEAPAVTTNAADNVTTSSATLNGNLTSLGDYSPVNVSFEWGTEPGVYSDNTTPEAMTSTGVFSDNLSGLVPSTTYYFRAKATGSVTVYGGELSFTTLKVLASIDITPDNPTIALGRTQQFTATGTYSDNSTGNITATVTWTSDNTSVATIDATGLAQSLAEGTTNISATLGAISDNTTLTVGPKVLDSMEITPDNPTIALGRAQQFTATGTYSDNSTDNITTTVAWTSDNTTVATIGTNTGLAQSLAEGQTTITATLGEISDNTTLTVSLKVLDTIAVTPPNPSIDAGRTKQFTATGTYSDNSTDNLTSSATWSSSNTTVAMINAAGLATSYAEGTTVITATSDNVSDNTTLTVNPAVLDSVTVTPANPAIVFVSDNAPTLQFIATAGYSDGATDIVTSTANWTSSDTGVATISATGLATTVAAGTTTITATYIGTTGNTTLTVLPDTVPPVVTLTSPTEGQIFSNNTTTVAGTVDDLAATANVTVNGGSPIALTLGASGNFTKSISLNTGSNTVLVTAVDGSGNTGTSGTITVVVDPGKPTITITQPVAGIVTDNSSLAVIGTVSGNITSANLILNGVSQSVSVASGSFSANVTLVEGINILVVNAYTAGNEGDSDYLGTSGVRIVTLDTTAPVVIISSPVSGSVVSTPGHEVSGTIDDPGVSTANLTLNGASQWIPVVGGIFSQNITLVSGNNTITVVATDEIGNTSPADSVTIIFDNTKPEVTITAPVNNLVTNVAGQAVTGTVNDPTITTATLYVNGTPQTISVAPGGSFSENVTLATGANTLEVRASDNATNTGTSGVVNVTVDNTAPTITIGLSDPTDSITITVTSNEALAAAPTVSANSTVTMTQIDVNKWSGTYGSAGSPIATGAYTVSANATDRAGNTTTRTATFGKQTVTVSENETATVLTDTTTLQISTTANVTDASISVTSTMQNPSGNIGNPEGAEKAAGVFVEIVVSPELRDNLKQIYITVDYDPDELPADTDESTLRLYLWDVASGTWQMVPDSGVNTTEHYIYGTVTSLSKYGGFGTAAAPPAPAPSSGGGGGGGSGGVTDDARFTSFGDAIKESGELLDDIAALSLDNKLRLDIPTGTFAKNRNNVFLFSIRVTTLAEPPEVSENMEMIGLAYELTPAGANFDPPITLTFRYDTAEIPQGVSEENLIVAIWDQVDQKWVELESTVDPETHTISTKIDHFSTYTVMARTRPASFTIADLSLTPDEVDLGESISISVLITNTGDLTGSYEVSLKIDDVVAQTKEVTLAGGDTETVTFSVPSDAAGEYTVNINDLLGTFEVKAPEAPPAPPPAPAVAPAPPSFDTSDLSVTPSEVKPAEQVTISAVITNTGGSEGSYTVVLKINGAEEAKKEVTLGAGKSETVTFTIAKDTEGSYTVNIDGKVGQFTVIVPPPPTPTEALPIQPPTNWWLIGGIIAGCVVAAGLLVYYFFVWRKRGAPRPA